MKFIIQNKNQVGRKWNIILYVCFFFDNSGNQSSMSRLQKTENQKNEA